MTKTRFREPQKTDLETISHHRRNFTAKKRINIFNSRKFYTWVGSSKQLKRGPEGASANSRNIKFADMKNAELIQEDVNM